MVLTDRQAGTLRSVERCMRRYIDGLPRAPAPPPMAKLLDDYRGVVDALLGPENQPETRPETRPQPNVCEPGRERHRKNPVS